MIAVVLLTEDSLGMGLPGVEPETDDGGVGMVIVVLEVLETEAAVRAGLMDLDGPGVNGMFNQASDRRDASRSFG